MLRTAGSWFETMGIVINKSYILSIGFLVILRSIAIYIYSCCVRNVMRNRRERLRIIRSGLVENWVEWMVCWFDDVWNWSGLLAGLVVSCWWGNEGYFLGALWYPLAHVLLDRHLIHLSSHKGLLYFGLLRHLFHPYLIYLLWAISYWRRISYSYFFFNLIW